MIGKITQGKYFAGLIKYVTAKEGAYLLDSEGVLLQSLPGLIRSFETQSQMRPSLSNKVGHISLNFSPRDKDRMTDEYMTGIAREYLQGMGITDTQYLIVRHTDREHPHCHIVFNRVNNTGQPLKDSNNFRKNRDICKGITLTHKLYMPQGKENIKIDHLREPYRTKYEIWQAVKEALPHIRSWEKFNKYLYDRNITLSFKYKGTSQEIQGIIFTKGKYSFKGSAIDRRFSYAKITWQIKRDNSLVQKASTKQPPQSSASPANINRNKIASNIANYLNSIGARTSQRNKLLKWDDERDEEEEEIEELLNSSKRKLKL